MSDASRARQRRGKIRKPFKLSAKEWVLLIISSVLTLPGLVGTPLWILLPSTITAWIGYLFICFFHNGFKFVRSSAGVVVTLILCAIVVFRSSEVPPEILLASQIQEIQKLDQFIGDRDESELRELFDFPQMIAHNIQYAKGMMIPNSMSDKERIENVAFFHGGEGISNFNLLATAQYNGGGVHAAPIEGRVSILNLSEKCVKNVRILSRFETSDLLLRTIRRAIADLHNAIMQDEALMLTVLDQELVADPNNLIQEDNPNSPFGGVASGAYWRQFVDLQPKQEAIDVEIRKYLKVD